MSASASATAASAPASPTAASPTAAKRPPAFRGHWLLGALPFLGQGFHRRLVAEHEELGDVFTMRFGPVRIFSMRDPTLVEQVLVTDRHLWTKTGSPAYQVLAELLGDGLVTAEGKNWLKHRRLAQPAFHRERIARMVQTMIGCAADTAQRFEEAAALGAPIDFAREMLLFTQRVIGKTMLSVDLQGTVGLELADALELGLRAVEVRSDQVVRLPLWVPTANNRRMRRSRQALDAMIYALIAERRRARQAGAQPGPDGDLLDMLVDAVDEETGAVLTDTELRDDVMTIFLAGHETTSNLLSWVATAFGPRPDVQEELATELAATSPQAVARPTSGDPTLCDRVVDEAMRWRPPVWTVDRVAQAPTQLAGYDVHKGDMLLVSPWTLHHNKALWPDPDRFDPARFLPEAAAGRPKHAFLPFLAGNRKCMGDVFALTEAKVALATWLPRFRFTPQGLPEEELAVTLRPRGGVMVRVERR
jgi:cytochrome P450